MSFRDSDVFETRAQFSKYAPLVKPGGYIVVDGLNFNVAVGKAVEKQVDVRFLFASHIDLEQRVKEGVFRKDLFRRMGASYNKIEIPGLRRRKSDIAILARFFLENYRKRANMNIEFGGRTLQLWNIMSIVKGTSRN